MSEDLIKSGIFFDEVDKVRILDPTSAKQVNDLRDECKIYIESWSINFSFSQYLIITIL